MASRDINERLLRLCGFETDKEVEAFLPSWLETADKFELSDEDVRFAVEEWIPTNWDVQYRGVRMMIGGWLRALDDLRKTPQYKAEGKKIIYGILPTSPTPFNTFKYVGGDDVFVSFPDLIMIAVLNGFFHKAAPLLDIAEEEGFNYGCRHCPLNKMRYISFKKGIIADPDVIWVWGVACDEGPKTDEFIKHMTGGDGWNYVVSRIPHDTCKGDDDVAEERVRYLAEVFKEDMAEISKITGIYPTEEDFKGFAKSSLGRKFKYGMLSNLVSTADPVPLGGNDLTMFANGVSMPMNGLETYFEAAIDVMTKEVRAAIKAGEGVLPKGAPRIGNYFTSFCNPWIDRELRRNGIAQTFCMSMTPSKAELEPSKYDENVYMTMAEEWLKGPMGMNASGEIETMIEKVRDNKPDGMLMGFYDYDRWLGAHHKICATRIEEATGVPTYYIEGDCMDDREYSLGALQTRIESICNVIHQRKEAEAD